MSIFAFLNRKRRMRQLAFEASGDFIKLREKERKKLSDEKWLRLLNNYLMRRFPSQDKDSAQLRKFFLLYFNLTPKLLGDYLAIFDGLSLFSTKYYSLEDVRLILNNAKSTTDIPILILANFVDESKQRQVGSAISELRKLPQPLTTGDIRNVVVHTGLSYKQVMFLNKPL